MQILIAGIIGFIAGTLINYLGDVLPWTRKLSLPVCNQCGQPIGWMDYASLRPCSAGHSRRLRWLTVWAISLSISIAMMFFPPIKVGYYPGIVIFTFLGLLALVDIEHKVVLNETVIIGLVICLAYGIWLHGVRNALIGGAFGFGSMLLLYGLGILFSRWMASKRGMPADEVALGFGDVNLTGILGLLLGWPLIFASLLSSILLAGLISAFLLLGMVVIRKYRPFQAIPYAPFLIISAGIFLYLLK